MLRNPRAHSIRARARLFDLFALALVLLTLAACSHQRLPVSAAPPVTPNNNSYLDLAPPSALRIVVPLLKSGAFRSHLIAENNAGNTISLRADDLIGYTTSHYAVTGKDGQVRLKFFAAEETRDGKTVAVLHPGPLPFPLPRKTEHLRLVYLVRASQADHNMAIVGAKRLDALNAFTLRLQNDPQVCSAHDEIFCSWVPAGVAVRQEALAPHPR